MGENIHHKRTQSTRKRKLVAEGEVVSRLGQRWRGVSDHETHEIREKRLRFWFARGGGGSNYNRDSQMGEIRILMKPRSSRRLRSREDYFAEGGGVSLLVHRGRGIFTTKERKERESGESPRID